MHQGNEEEIGGRTKFEKEKTLPSATIGLTFLWGLTKKSVLPLLALTKKSIVSPFSSFPKEENGDTTDFSVNPYLRVSQALYENKKL